MGVFTDFIWRSGHRLLGRSVGGCAVKQFDLAGDCAAGMPSPGAVAQRKVASAIPPMLGCGAGKRCGYGMESGAFVFLYRFFGRAKLQSVFVFSILRG